MFAATTRHNVREGVVCHRESGGFYMCVYYIHMGSQLSVTNPTQDT